MMSGRRFMRRVGGGEWPAGTAPLLYQDAAPPGYAIVAAVDEHSVRLTDGDTVNGGTTGGTNDFSTQFATLAESATPGVGDRILVAAETPSGITRSLFKVDTSSGGTSATEGLVGNVSAGGGAHGHTVDLRVKWAACIVVQKL